tara:strand:+ start:36 stop:683 length:648 start_codon:yes stop_codon:yes gene_type:complete
MDNVLINNYSKISDLNVSRETFVEFEAFISMIQEKNKEINIISKKNGDKIEIRDRHIVDSAQIIDFIDLNSNTTCDLGSGGGMPGLIVAILMKKLNSKMIIKLYEKSHHKCQFLGEVTKKLKLNTEINKKDVFKCKVMKTGTIMTRAFKPMPVILDLVNNNFLKYKNLVMFMGKSGKEILNQALIEWELDLEEKKSLTNKESFLLNIKKIKKKIL